MLAVLGVVAPVFMVVAAGYSAARLHGFGRAWVDGLMAFAVRYAAPLLLFSGMYRLDLSQAFDLRLLASFYAGSLGSFVLAIILARLVWRRRPGEAVAIGFCAMFSNTLFLGVPVMTLAYGEGALPPVFSILAIHAPLHYAVGIVTMETLRRDGTGAAETAARAAGAILSNALTIGIASGLLLNALSVRLPGFAETAMEMMARAALPVALFGLGGAMTRYAIRADLGEAAMATTLSIVVHPLVAFVLGAHVFAMPDDLLRAAVITSAMPTGMNGYVFAAMYDRAMGAAASTVLLSTALSVATITFWLWLLGGAALG
ncbi:MAG: AEC family transporter [Rhodobacteraceae bacterium]|nr:MAG: AEC family transporter [Paracoccaceae bacterium]